MSSSVLLCPFGSLLVAGPVGIAIGTVAVIALGGVITPSPPAKKIHDSIITAIRKSAYCDKNELRKAIGECLGMLRRDMVNEGDVTKG